MVSALFVFVLLASFNRTMNRLTKPVSAFVALSVLGSGFISSFYYFKKIEGEIVLSKFMDFFETMPKVKHTIKFKCQKCGEELSYDLEGLMDFFS